MESKTLANVNSAFDLESLEIVDGIEVIEHFNDIENENENGKNNKPIILDDLDSSLEIKYLTLLKFYFPSIYKTYFYNIFLIKITYKIVF